MSKTVLVPNAPWPVFVEPEPPKHKFKHDYVKPVRAIKPPKKKVKKRQFVDDNFERWLREQTPVKTMRSKQ